jgi:hypothetical protein
MIEQYNLGVDWEPAGKPHPRNLMPEPYRPLDYAEAMRAMFNSTWGTVPAEPFARHFRQIRLEPFPWLAGVHVWYVRNLMYLVSMAIATHEWNKFTPPAHFRLLNESGFYLGFYRLGCLHENRKHVIPHMFSHIITCPDCDLRYGYDSSG